MAGRAADVTPLETGVGTRSTGDTARGAGVAGRGTGDGAEVRAGGVTAPAEKPGGSAPVCEAGMATHLTLPVCVMSTSWTDEPLSWGRSAAAGASDSEPIRRTASSESRRILCSLSSEPLM